MAGSRDKRRSSPSSSAKRTTTTIDRRRSTSSRGSSTTSNGSTNWKHAQTHKVAITPTATGAIRKKKKVTPPHSSSSEDEDNNNEDDEERSREEDDDTDSDGEGEDEDSAEVVMRQNKSNSTYRYKMTTNARQSGPMTTLETQPGRNQNSSIPANNAPKAIWNNIENQMQEVKIEKTAVHDFVSNYLFPKLKFLRGAGINLEYSSEAKSICGLVMAGCHQEHSTDGMMWWGTAKKQTINEIKRLRNDASKNLKISFLGKLLT